MADPVLIERIYKRHFKTEQPFDALSDAVAGFVQGVMELETELVRFDNEKGSNFANEFRRKVAEVDAPGILRRAGQF